MRQASLRDLLVVLAAVVGFHALFISVPTWLAQEEPSLRLLPLTAPDCATLLRDGGRPASGWFRGGTGPDIPASPVRR